MTKGSPVGVQHALGTDPTHCQQALTLASRLLLKLYRDCIATRDYNQKNREAPWPFPWLCPSLLLYVKAGTLTEWMRKMWSDNGSVRCWGGHANVSSLNYPTVWFSFLPSHLEMGWLLLSIYEGGWAPMPGKEARDSQAWTCTAGWVQKWLDTNKHRQHVTSSIPDQRPPLALYAYFLISIYLQIFKSVTYAVTYATWLKHLSS